MSALEHGKSKEPRSTDTAGWSLDKREFVLDHRESILDERERVADERDSIADIREMGQDDRSRALADRDGGDAPASGTSNARDARAAAALSRGEARRIALAAVEVARSDLARSQRLPPLVAEFAVLAKHLHGSTTVSECCDDIVRFTDRMMTSADSVSVLTVENSVLRTRAATSDTARAIDGMQIASTQSPARQALTQHEPVVSGSLADDGRWPEFGPMADAAGVASVLSVSIHLDREPAQVIGTLNQYATDADAFDRADQDVAVVLAAHAAVAIDSVRVSARADALSVGMRTRDVVGQAKGILMERGRLTADQAFDSLRIASQRLNRRLADIAVDVATTGELPSTDPRP